MEKDIIATDRSNEEILKEIQHHLDTKVNPSVAGHGGAVKILEFKDGVLHLEMKGTCSGCAGSSMTLKFGVENMLKHYVPEVTAVEGHDDPNSTVDPYYKNDIPK